MNNGQDVRYNEQQSHQQQQQQQQLQQAPSQQNSLAHNTTLPRSSLDQGQAQQHRLAHSMSLPQPSLDVQQRQQQQFQQQQFQQHQQQQQQQQNSRRQTLNISYDFNDPQFRIDDPLGLQSGLSNVASSDSGPSGGEFKNSSRASLVSIDSFLPNPARSSTENHNAGLNFYGDSSVGMNLGNSSRQSPYASPSEMGSSTYRQAPNHFNALGSGLGRSMGGGMEEVMDFKYLYSLIQGGPADSLGTFNGSSILHQQGSGAVPFQPQAQQAQGMTPGNYVDHGSMLGSNGSSGLIGLNNTNAGLGNALSPLFGARSVDATMSDDKLMQQQQLRNGVEGQDLLRAGSVTSTASHGSQQSSSLPLNRGLSKGDPNRGSISSESKTPGGSNAQRKRPSKDVSSHMIRSVGIVQHTHEMEGHLDSLPPLLQKELLTFKKAIKKATMGDRLQFLHQCREELGKFAPFVAYEPTDKNMKRLKLNTKHFFSLRGGFNEDAKTESAQQAINKLNSLKMFFDQFPSMRVPTTQLGKPESKRMKSEPADKGAGTAAFTKASDQITQQPLQLLVFDITNQEFEQFFPRWDTNEIPLEPFVLEASSSIGQLQSQLMADRAPSVQDEPIEINIHTISKRLQSGLFCTTTTPLGGLTEIRKSNQNGIVCLPIRSKRPQMVTFRHRELDFQQVCKYFDSHTCGGVVLLTGMAGVGKTVFCARYLWELFERERNGNAAAYRVTLWLDCSGLTTRTECETAFAGFASPAYLELQTPDDASNAQIIEHILYKWFFANKGQWLIVVDNVNAIGAEHIFDLLHPISSSGSVLVSSRWNEISLNGNGKDLKLKLDVVALDSAVEFLVTRSGMSEQAAQTQLSDIEGVAEKLGRLPQALDIVGERLRGSVQTFSDFNKSLQHTGSLKSVLSSLSPTGAQSLLSTFRQIAYSIPEGPSTELLNIIAYLPSIHIPIAIFTGFEHARHDFPKQVKVAFPNTELYRALEGQPQAIHSIIAPLLNSAVVNKLTEATGVLGMHPVVQEILRELMKPEECVKYRSAAVELLYSALCVERNDDDSMYSLGIDALIPHVWDVLSNSSSVQTSSMACLGLWCKFGEYVNYMCQYSMVGPAQKADFGQAMYLAKQRGIEDSFQDIMLAWVRFKRQRRINSCKNINLVESLIHRSSGDAPDVDPQKHATTDQQPYNQEREQGAAELPAQIQGKLVSQLHLRPLDQRIVNMVYSKVMVEPVTHPHIVTISPTACALLGVDGEATLAKEAELAANLMSGNQAIEGSQSTAHLYCGHQFGNFAGQLGDGRAHSMGRVVSPLAGHMDKGGFDASFGPFVELQFKGSGRTPYSRTADGRAVLRSSIREFLCSEYMAALRIPTTRAAILVNSDTQVTRDPLYVGKPIRENASIVSRIAPSFWRVGSFEIFTAGKNGVEGPYAGEIDRCSDMLDFYIKQHFSHIWKKFPHGKPRYIEFFSEVCARNARTVAMWQSVGFVHGVLNTDNISLLGLTLDYGPFGFMDSFNPHYVPNYSDTDERYAYENQPKMIYWGLGKLAKAISGVVPLDELIAKLNQVFWPVYVDHFHSIVMRKWGMVGRDMKKRKAATQQAEKKNASAGTNGVNEDSGKVDSSSLKVPQAKKNSASTSKTAFADADVLDDAIYDNDEKLISRMMQTMEETGADFTNTFRCLSNIVAHEDGPESPESLSSRENVLDYIVSQLDDGREMANTMPYEVEYLKVLSTFPVEHDDVLLALTGKHVDYFKQRMESVARAKRLAAVSPFQKDDEDRAKWAAWLKQYQSYVNDDWKLAEASGATLTEYNTQRVTIMNTTNPKFCLRNYMAQSAFEKAKLGDFTELQTLTKILSRPFDEWEQYESLKYDRHASSLRMCISCSS